MDPAIAMLVNLEFPNDFEISLDEKQGKVMDNNGDVDELIVNEMDQAEREGTSKADSSAARHSTALFSFNGCNASTIIFITLY